MDFLNNENEKTENEEIQEEIQPELPEPGPKVKILIIGYARHGKDSVCEILRDRFGYRFVSSSYFAAEKVVFPALAEQYGYATVEEAYADRSNHRAEWFNLIAEYNAEDLTRLAREMLVEHDIYCGMRNREELLACQEQGVFDYYIWVDATERGLPAEDESSCTVMQQDTQYTVTNNGTVETLVTDVDALIAFIREQEANK